MKRKTTKTPTRIVTYGAKLPHENRDLFVDQLCRGHRYYNELVAVEHARREAIRIAESSMTDDDREYVRERKKQHKAGVKNAAPADRVAARERLVRDLKRIPGYAAIESANDAAAEKVRQARKACGLHFGTYLLVEKSVEAAKAKPTLHFRRWGDHAGVLPGGGQMPGGRIGAHIMGGCAALDLRQNTMLQIDWPELGRSDDGMTWDATRGQRRKEQKTVARIRIGSDDRKPVWTEFRASIHRPLPPDAKIKAGWLLVRYVGTQWRCELQLQVESEHWQRATPVGKGTVAVDLNWRRRDDGIRVAYLCDTEGVHREVIVPEDIGHDLDRANAIRATADTLFEESREALAHELGSLALPDEHAEKFASLRQWKSPQRLQRAIDWWWSHRFGGDGDAWDVAMTWLHRWRHLHGYEAGVRRNALARRKKYYEEIAKRIVTRYARIVIGKFDMRSTVELDKGAEDAPLPARHNRVAVSPSEFRLLLKSAAARQGAEIVEVDCQDATVRCSACDRVNDVDPYSVDWRCVECASPWDRGENHCRNLLLRASGAVAPYTSSPLAPMIPRTSAKPVDARRVRDRAGKRRSKNRRRGMKQLSAAELTCLQGLDPHGT